MVSVLLPEVVVGKDTDTELELDNDNVSVLLAPLDVTSLVLDEDEVVRRSLLTVLLSWLETFEAELPDAEEVD